MKPRVSIALFMTVFLLILLPSVTVQAQPYIRYSIQLNSDGSAAWTITQVSDINGTVDSWIGFQEKVNGLVAAAANETHRPMAVDDSSFQMGTNIPPNSSSKTTDYMFTWLNFSETTNTQLIVGDVFNVPNFFGQLYGDGELQITYSSNYTLQKAIPVPDSNDSSTQTLQWLGTQFFVTEQPSIILDLEQTTVHNSWQPQYVLIGLVSVVVSATLLASWFFLRNQRKIQNNIAPPPTITKNLIETEEEKILRVLRSSGGSTYQAIIKEQCKFSKAKISQLLSNLEAKGIVRRYKKGRDKIVDVVEQSKR